MSTYTRKTEFTRAEMARVAQERRQEARRLKALKLTSREIAKEMDCSVWTVRTYCMPQTLTPSMLRVIEQIGEGFTNEKIAELLGVKSVYVKQVITHARRVLGLGGVGYVRQDIYRTAKKRGLLDPPQ